MNWADLTDKQHRALCVAGAVGSLEAIDVMRSLLNEAIADDANSEEFDAQISKTMPYELLTKAEQIIDEAMFRCSSQEHPAAQAAIWAFKEMVHFAWDRWGISDTTVSLRVLNYAALGKAQPGTILAGLICSLHQEDFKRGRK